MTDNQHSELKASTDKQKSGFTRRVIWIREFHRMLIEKDCLSLFKGNTMLLLIDFVLMLIPRKAYHNYNITTI